MSVTNKDTVYAYMVRKSFGEGDAERDRGLSTPHDIRRYDDIIYGDNMQEWQSLDVYRPFKQEGKLPVILSVHGGGWVYGDKNVYQYYCMSLAKHGFAVVNFSYRLAPEYQYPASFEDLNTVCLWIKEHEEEYGFDTDHVFAVGDSAGGHMLALYACALTNPAYREQCGYDVQDLLRFQALALNCGAYDFRKVQEDIIRLMKVYLPDGGTREELELMSPVLHITEDFPPSFVMTANEDFLKPQAEYLIPVFVEKKVPYVYHCYGTEAYPLSHVFHCNMRLTEAAVCNKEECDFFRSFL